MRVFFILNTSIFLCLNIAAQQTNINGPAGSGRFGTQVVALPNGNIVVTDPFYDAPGPIANVGAVYLYNGANGNLISTITGSTANDQVGSGGITVLTNGNYVVRSPIWNSASQNVGAVTFGNGTSGISGVVSSSNSLVGSTASDLVGSGGVTALTNGNYVVRSTGWDGTAQDVGAVTFGNGTSGITGVVSSSNSLVGSTESDFVGSGGVTALTNGNYVVRSQNWDGTAVNVGAVTFGNGTSGIAGVVSASNSLVGSTANDNVGGSGVTALSNGNYVVSSPNWDNGGIVNSGAVSYLSGQTGNFAPLPDSNDKTPKPDDAKEQPSDNLTVSMSNSVLGTTANGGSSMNFSFDAVNNQLVVGRPFDNIVTLFKRLGITAANVSVSGRVLTSTGRGIPRAIVSITDTTGGIRYARTNSFGYFHFEDVGVGQTYIFDVQAKGYTFATQVLNINEDIKGLNFTAQ